jgi:3-oxoacyl-[acyl-carrier-protein] synthase-3
LVEELAMERPIRILGTGKYLPGRLVTGEDLDRRLGLEEGTISKKSGVRERRWVAEGDTSVSMAARASSDALHAAGMKKEELDAIVFAAAVPHQPIPCSAALLQRELGLERSGISCFDVNSTCLSWVTALDMVSYAMAAGRWNKVLLVAAEAISPGLNFNHLESSTLFGDGAAAAVIGKSERGEGSRIVASHMETYSTGADDCRVKGGGTAQTVFAYSKENDEDYRFYMDGPTVFKLALHALPKFVGKLLGSARASLNDIKLVIPHQASGTALALMRRKLEVPEERWMDILATHGNCVAASIPMTLHEAVVGGRLKRGDLGLLLGTSAGFSMGGVVFEY